MHASGWLGIVHSALRCRVHFRHENHSVVSIKIRAYCWLWFSFSVCVAVEFVYGNDDCRQLYTVQYAVVSHQTTEHFPNTIFSHPCRETWEWSWPKMSGWCRCCGCIFIFYLFACRHNSYAWPLIPRILAVLNLNWNKLQIVRPDECHTVNKYIEKGSKRLRWQTLIAIAK